MKIKSFLKSCCSPLIHLSPPTFQFLKFFFSGKEKYLPNPNPSQPGVTLARADCKCDNLSVTCSLYFKDRERQQKTNLFRHVLCNSTLQEVYCKVLIGNTQLLATPTHYTNNWDENLLRPIAGVGGCLRLDLASQYRIFNFTHFYN